jgi:NadR type nicotinamide-nucleotide adenylyltransferase
MKRIVIIGPESTGKSTLCQQLAQHYNTLWCPEYARQYLVENGATYNYDDLAAIAKGQLKLQAATETEVKSDFYFIDTDMNVMKVWHEVVFNLCPTWILKTIAQTHNDLYLLCDTDLPWAKDELREYPDITFRQKLFRMYKDAVINSGTPWTVVSGSGNQRLQSAMTAVESMVKKTKLS